MTKARRPPALASLVIALGPMLAASGCTRSSSLSAEGPPKAPCLLDYDHPHDHHHAGETSHGEGPSESTANAARGVVVPHDGLQTYENNGNELVGIATRSLGAVEHEVWRSRVAVGSATPLHTHESEEIFVFLKGRGRARIGDQTVEFTAPATVIAPAGVPHQFFNTGEEPTDAIVVVRPGSQITNAEGAPMDLPWRN